MHEKKWTYFRLYFPTREVITGKTDTMMTRAQFLEALNQWNRSAALNPANVNWLYWTDDV